MTATRSNHFTTGRIYENVIRKERRGDYLGGTVGDIESLWCGRKHSVPSPHLWGRRLGSGGKPLNPQPSPPAPLPPAGEGSERLRAIYRNCYVRSTSPCRVGKYVDWANVYKSL